ncbi:MAG: FecR family protein [Puniceicoccales bacterium]
MKFLKILILAAAASLFISNAQAQEKLGTIKAFLVKGNVTLINNAGQSMPLKRGQEFGSGTTVVTGDNSSALLLFSNGASVNVTPNTKYSINQFEQAAYDPALGTFLRLKEDPSVSNTQTALEYGQLIGEVRKLGPGSQYTINTPIASAGIRGTVWVLQYNPASQTFTASNVTGDVVVYLPDGSTVEVPADSSYTIVSGMTEDQFADIDPQVLADAQQTATVIENAGAVSINVQNDSTIVVTPETDVILDETGVVISGTETVIVN